MLLTFLCKSVYFVFCLCVSITKRGGIEWFPAQVSLFEVRCLKPRGLRVFYSPLFKLAFQFNPISISVDAVAKFDFAVVRFLGAHFDLCVEEDETKGEMT